MLWKPPQTRPLLMLDLARSRYDICSGGDGDPAQNKTLLWPCRKGFNDTRLTVHGQYLHALKSLLGSPEEATLQNFTQFSTLPAGQAVGFAVGTAGSGVGKLVVVVVVDETTYTTHTSITIEFDAGTLAAHPGAAAQLFLVLPQPRRLDLPLTAAKSLSGGVECRVPMDAMALAPVGGATSSAIGFIEIGISGTK